MLFTGSGQKSLHLELLSDKVLLKNSGHSNVRICYFSDHDAELHTLHKELNYMELSSIV